MSESITVRCCCWKGISASENSIWVGTYIGFSESSEVLFVPVFPLPLDQTLSLFRSIINLILRALTKRSRGCTPCALLPVLKWSSEQRCPSHFSTQGCCSHVLSEPPWAASQPPWAEGFVLTMPGEAARCRGRVPPAAAGSSVTPTRRGLFPRDSLLCITVPAGGWWG